MAGGSRAHRCARPPASRSSTMSPSTPTSSKPVLGKSAPIAVLPFLNSALADSLPFQHSVEGLRDGGVQVLLGRCAFEPHSPRMGQDGMGVGLWSLAIEAIEETARDDSAVGLPRGAHGGE